MTYKLFLDDERTPVFEDWVIARSSNEAIELLKERGIPTEIALDHDLGGDDTSMKYIRYLIDYVFCNDLRLPKDFRYYIHSMNPVGAKNIERLMKGFVKVMETQGEE